MIVEQYDLINLRKFLKNLKIGYTSGVFDIFHEGHKIYIDDCRKKCDILVIGVDDNNLVSQRKGNGRPINSIDVRLAKVNEYTDFVFTKKLKSVNYTSKLEPDFYFFSEQNVPDSRKIEELSRSPNFKSSISIPYYKDVSTTSIINESKKQNDKLGSFAKNI